MAQASVSPRISPRVLGWLVPAWALVFGAACDSAARSPDGGALDGAADREAAGDTFAGTDGPRGVITTFDRGGCAQRPVGACDDLQPIFTSNSADMIKMSPELAACAAFISFDGCEKLVFSIAADGCLESVETFADNGDHLKDLRTCLGAGLGAARWPCLVGATVRFEETCLVR